MDDVVRRPARTEGRRYRIGLWLFLAAVLASALMLGSLLTWALCVIALALALANFLLWFDAEPFLPRPAATMLMAVAALLTAFTALQCVPIPASWLAALAPANADVWSRALRPLHLPGPGVVTVSLEPLATRIEVLRGITYMLAFAASLRIAQRREGVAFLQRGLIVCGIALAVAALIHPAFGAEKVFWIYEPVNRVNMQARHIAPLLNANHLAAYVNIAMCIAFASSLESAPIWPRSILVAMFLTLVGVGFWVGSRGGLVAGLLGILISFGMARAFRRGARAVTISALALGAVLVMALGMVVFSSSTDTWIEVVDTSTSKLTLAKQGLRLTRLSPWLGIGRGAFAAAFPAVSSIPGYVAFSHPENLVTQWTAEWGIPIAALGFASIAFALRPSTVMVRSQPPVGAWAALVVTAVHNLVDFSLEVPGVVIPLAVCAAIIVGGRASRSRAVFAGWASNPRSLAIAGVAMSVAASILVLPGIPHELVQERLALYSRTLDKAETKADFEQEVRAAMTRHPAEPYLPFLGALRAARAKDDSVIPWIERTLERAPIYSFAHLLLAQWIYSRSPSQARLEYRLALEQDISMYSFLQKEGIGLARSYDDACELVPANGSARTTALKILASDLALRLPSTAVRLDEELRRIDPDAIDPVRRAAQAAVADVEAGDGAPWCAAARDQCVERARAAIEALREKRPNECEAYALRSRVFLAMGDNERALSELEEASQRVQDWNACTRNLVEVAVGARDEKRARAGLDRLTGAGCGSGDECVDNARYGAEIELRRGNLRRALGFYKQAYERSPNDDLLALQAELAARIGLHAEALKDYVELASKNPADPRWQARVTFEREALARAVVIPP